MTTDINVVGKDEVAYLEETELEIICELNNQQRPYPYRAVWEKEENTLRKQQTCVQS